MPSGSLRSSEPSRIDMTELQIETDRAEHPLDVVERLAALRDWIFDRAETDEMSVSVSGRWTDYHIAFTWIEDVEAVHVACAFDLKVPDRRGNQVLQLIGVVKEQMWGGHHGMWGGGEGGVFRPGLAVCGGAGP